MAWRPHSTVASKGDSLALLLHAVSQGEAVAAAAQVSQVRRVLASKGKVGNEAMRNSGEKPGKGHPRRFPRDGVNF